MEGGGVLLVHRAGKRVVLVAKEVVSLLEREFPALDVYCDGDTAVAPQWGGEPVRLVVALGGDGTLLHAAALFQTGSPPPVLALAMGSLGFLAPFPAGGDRGHPAWESARRALRRAVEGRGRLQRHERLAVQIGDG